MKTNHCLFFFILALVLVLALPSKSIAEKKLKPNQTYVKVITPESGDSARKSHHCNERFDLPLTYDGSNILKPGDDFYINQYDAIVSASVLCGAFAAGPQYYPHVQYHTYLDQDHIWNMDGTPVQYWLVQGYCIAEEGDYGYRADQIVLLCLDHETIE